MPFIRLENEIVNLSEIRRIAIKVSAMEAPAAPLTHSVYIVGEYANGTAVRLCKVGDIAGEKSDEAVKDAQVYLESLWGEIKSEKSFDVKDALPTGTDDHSPLDGGSSTGGSESGSGASDAPVVKPDGQLEPSGTKSLTESNTKASHK